MKGIVFTKFIEMVESRFGLETMDQMIEQAKLPSGGVYTAVGTYDHTEIVQLVVSLSKITGTPAPDLVKAFGKYLFSRFVIAYPRFFQEPQSTFDLLSRIENHIHVEVRKLYPDAELPSFECRNLGPGKMEMIYRSKRHFEDLAEGLILGCAEHFGEAITISREALPADHEGGAAVRFTLTRAAENEVVRKRSA